MFLLKKIIPPFLLPPGIFILALALSGLWFLKNKLWKAGAVNLLIGAGLWLVSIAPVSDALVRGLVADLELPVDVQADVIVVLGGGIYSDVQDMTGIGAPSNEMLSRIVTAVRLQKKLGIPLIVSTGAVFPWEKSEAVIDERILLDMGIPRGKILLEDKSRDTIENARFTKVLCDQYGFRKPLLVTSALHMRRALLSFKKVNFDVTPFPVNLHMRRSRDYVLIDFLPGDPEIASLALREYLGLLFYRFAY